MRPIPSALRRGVLVVALGASMLGASFAAAAADDAALLRGDPATYAKEGDQLFDLLATAKTEGDARVVEDEIWHHWFLPPDPEAAGLMAQALEKRSAYDYAGAVEVLDKLIAANPDWAEAWNQRATIRFLQGDFQGSLDDIEETLQREPRHFGALSGMAIILMQQGRAEQAQAVLRKAVKIDPFLRERSMLVAVPGEKI